MATAGAYIFKLHQFAKSQSTGRVTRARLVDEARRQRSRKLRGTCGRCFLLGQEETPNAGDNP